MADITLVMNTTTLYSSLCIQPFSLLILLKEGELVSDFGLLQGGNMKTSSEIYSSIRQISIKKANLSILQMLSLSILAGIYIALGAIGAITALANVQGGIGKFMGAAIFPVGLMLVIIAGAELFTGNNLMTIGWLNKDINTSQLSKNWFWVYVGNFIGSLLMVYSISMAGILKGGFSEKAISIAIGKVELISHIGFSGLIVKAALCNILVVLAVWIAASTNNFTGKILACWFPIMLFVFSGFEHSIANIFFIFAGKLAGADITITQIFMNNIIPVTIGNIIGGAIIIPVFYHVVYQDKNPTQELIYKTQKKSS